jgi:hypothetical protein
MDEVGPVLRSKHASRGRTAADKSHGTRKGGDPQLVDEAVEGFQRALGQREDIVKSRLSRCLVALKVR